LFVLKYQRSRVLVRLFIYFFFVLFFGLCAFVPLGHEHELVFPLLAKFVFGFLSLWILFQLIDLLLFKEVRLCQDRIVKVWNWIGDKGIKLEDASLTTSIPGGRNARTVCNQDTKWYLRGIAGIFWCEDLADPKEVKKLNSLLAHLCGRKIQEIEQPATIKKLIKEGERTRPVDDYAFNEDLLNEDPNEKEFIRVADIGLLVFALFLLLGMCILWYPFVRKLF
jgi:hypothetical protein